ncbi:hypothetical protein ACFS2C_26185 [Prauserella oleivorans]|uniref:PPE domain-containing protein n=1 Tax=Prauserella oleivorans TaxID=1478153 RepID=A0ABW5WFV8_9PSEU
MVLPLLAAAGGVAAGAWFTQDEAENQSSSHGDRQIDAFQIYQQITSGPGADSLIEGQSSTQTLQSRYEQRIAQIEQLNQKMDAAWTGEGGASARSGAHPLKIWMEDSNTNLGISGTALDGQYQAFDRVYREVEPLPQEPPESGFWNDINPLETDTDRAIADYNAKAEKNVRAFDVYFGESAANASRMPRYTSVSGEFGDIKLDENGGGDDGGTGRITIPQPGDGTGSGTGGTPGGGVPGGSYPGGSGGYPGGSGGIPGGGTPGGSYPGGNTPGGSYPGGNYPGGTPGGNYPGGTYPGGSYPGGGGYTAPEWDDSTSASSYTPPSYSRPDFQSGNYGPGAGGFSTGGFGPGSSGGGSGSGSVSGIGAVGGFGPGGASGAGAGTAGPGAASGAATPGANSGAGAAGAAGARPGAAAAAGSAAGRGAGMMPMGAGAGRGQGSDDEEHQRKFLIDEDGNTLFGTDEKTAPPVIGE